MGEGLFSDLKGFCFSTWHFRRSQLNFPAVFSPVHPRFRAIAFGLFSAFLLFMAFNIHSRAEPFSYRSQIYSDKSGYYVYLPATFIYGFEGEWTREKLPGDAKQDGFQLSSEGRIQTKYPAGVALMQVPFWLLTHYVVAPLAGAPADGYSSVYHGMIDVAAVTYTCLAFLLLWSFLRGYFSERVSFWTLAAFGVGSSIFYYAAVESGMSHAYSLFACSLFLYAVKRINRDQKLTFWGALCLGLSAGLLIATRPTNVFILPTYFFLDLSEKSLLKARFRRLLSPGGGLALLVMILICLPQLLYWKYAYGEWLVYSYAGESFKNWDAPRLLRLWFAPRNGLFSHVPLLMLSMAGLVIMWRQRQQNRLFLSILFFGISYLFASWWSWNFGCGFGIRAFVDYFPFLMLPFGFVLEKVGAGQKPIPWVFGIAVSLLALFSWKNMYLYDLCFFGEYDWDWRPWLALMGKI